MRWCRKYILDARSSISWAYTHLRCMDVPDVARRRSDTMGAMTIPDDRLHELLRELSCEIELGRGQGSGWFGRHSMRPLSVTDREVLDLRRRGLLEVLVWDDGPPRPGPSAVAASAARTPGRQAARRGPL